MCIEKLGMHATYKQRHHRSLLSSCFSLVLSLVSVSPISLLSRRLSFFHFILLCILLFSLSLSLSLSLLIPLLALREKDQRNQPNQVSDIHTYIHLSRVLKLCLVSKKQKHDHDRLVEENSSKFWKTRKRPGSLRVFQNLLEFSDQRIDHDHVSIFCINSDHCGDDDFFFVLHGFFVYIISLSF